MPINNIKKIISVTFYSWAQYVGEYLCQHQPELARNEIDTQAALEEFIICGSTVKDDGTINCQVGICSRTAQKWLNRLGYKWKEVQKGGFFDGHKCEDVVKYQEIFLREIKSLLLYFVEFKEDSTILPKEYPDDCVVGSTNRQPIITITYDKSTFSANNSCQKIRTFENHAIFCPKGKRRGIIVSNFLLS